MPAACDEDHGEAGCPSCWRSSWRIACHGRDPMLGQGKSVGSPSLAEVGVGETACDELATTPFHPPVPEEEEVEEFGVKQSTEE